MASSITGQLVVVDAADATSSNRARAAVDGALGRSLAPLDGMLLLVRDQPVAPTLVLIALGGRREEAIGEGHSDGEVGGDGVDRERGHRLPVRLATRFVAERSVAEEVSKREEQRTV